MAHPRNPHITAENLGYWFFRLNGCMVLENFLVHHERRGREGTDVDILGVRFPYRQELALSGKPMEDHPIFLNNEKIELIIAEIKTGKCNLNGPWTDPERGNMVRVLHALGAFQNDEIEQVAMSLYCDTIYENDIYRCKLYALGKYKNEDLNPQTIQITWEETLRFIYHRFSEYRSNKSQHTQWDITGKRLFGWVNKFREEKEFIDYVMGIIE